MVWTFDFIVYALNALYFFVMIMRTEEERVREPDPMYNRLVLFYMSLMFACAVPAMATQFGVYASIPVTLLRLTGGFLSCVNMLLTIAFAAVDNTRTRWGHALAWFTLIGGLLGPVLQLLTVWL